MSAEQVALIPGCAECGDVWLPDDEERWRAYLDTDSELVFYCPKCAEQEFRQMRVSAVPTMLLLGAILCALVVTGCGASSSQHAAGIDETPDAFMKRLLEYDFKGQYGRSYDLLHPGQQPFVSRDKFQDCSHASSSEEAELKSIKTIEVYDDPRHSSGVPQTTSKAVTLRITYGVGTETGQITRTMHAVDIGTRWAWVLRTSDVVSYKAGECPVP